MARATRNAKLETRTSRSKLKFNHEPYWVAIGRTLQLGYRKGKQGGSWIARVYANNKYKKQKLGKADDFQDANNIDVLDYFQAQAKARKFADDQARVGAGVGNNNFTVTNAINNYLSWYKTHRKSYLRTSHVAKVHILPCFGDLLANKITTKMLRDWHESLASQAPRLRGTALKQNFAELSDTTEGIRKRKATANRILTILKAALNHAWRDGLVADDEAWRKVKPFRNVDAPKIRYLELTECQRLINVCEPDFRRLVRAALLTGCRYSELVRLVANDFNLTQGTVHISETKNGKPRYIPLTNEGIYFFEELTAGKAGGEIIFLRSDGEPWGISHQSRRLKDACEAANIEPTISFHVLRHTYGSLLASKGVPLQVIAELLGHSDTRITSRHYAHLMPSFVSDTLRANLPDFVKDKIPKVRKFAIAKGF